jgi:hypothetical protein
VFFIFIEKAGRAEGGEESYEEIVHSLKVDSDRKRKKKGRF